MAPAGEPEAGESGPAPVRPILTLEPLLEAVREGLEDRGWSLSGLQKTTSYEYRGRWEGESSRSAYLFFHHPDLPDWSSLDVFLDETSNGLRGSLALVVDGRRLGELPDVRSLLGLLLELALEALAPELVAPLSLRMRVAPDAPPDRAETECRLKVSLPGPAIESGPAAVAAVVRAAANAFEDVVSHPALSTFVRDT